MTARVWVEGHVGADPVVRFTNGGKAVLSFSVADTARIKSGDDWKDGETTWFKVTLWEGRAEAAAEVIKKGSLVSVYGRLTTEAWESNGDKRTGLRIDADSVGIVAKQSRRQPEVEEPPF